MEAWLMLGAIVLLAIFMAKKSGEKAERLNNLEEYIKDVEEDKELRSRMSDKSFRDKLRAFAKKNN
jgi:hypothetical protein